MELYILSKQDLRILSICKIIDYEINLDEETNAKSIFSIIKTEGLQEGNYVVVNGLYRQFLFVIPAGGVETEKNSNRVTLNVVDISNIFDRKIIEKQIEQMEENSIEQFIANNISENFVNSNDTPLNMGYIDVYWHTNTKAIVETNSENGLYNFREFLVNSRKNKNIYTGFKFENGRLRIDIENNQDTEEMIDTTLPEVAEYNKIYEEEVIAKVQVYVRENDSEYNLYLKTDRTTTTNKNDPNRARGKIEVISVDKLDKAAEEANNIMKNNNYKHLVEFKISKDSKLMEVEKLYIGRPVIIKTKEDIYNSYISAIKVTDENYIYFKSGSLRNTLLDKLKVNKNSIGDKFDKTGGIINGNLNVEGELRINKKEILSYEKIKEKSHVATYENGVIDPNETLEDLILTTHSNNPENGAAFYYIQTFFYQSKSVTSNRCQIAYSYGTHDIAYRFFRGTWSAWTFITKAAFCKMHISGIISHEFNEIIKHFGEAISYNGFIANTENYRLEIPKGTETIEVTGQLCGYGNCCADVLIKDTEGNSPANYNWQKSGILIQPYGNGYWKQCFTSGIVQLDKTKKYYVQLEAGGYRGQAFEINNGFGEYASWIQAKKIN